jgi:RimJ/RimL family protein N-acetyltransferase
VTLPRLAGPRVALVPVPPPVAEAVVRGDDPTTPLAGAGLRAAPGWPHADTADALRPMAEHGDPTFSWLVAVGGEVVGDCGWSGPPGSDGTVEIGYGLAAASRRQGLGTEAVAVLLTWTEQQPGVRAVAARVQVGNEPSRRLLRRLGFVEEPAEPSWVRAVRGGGVRIRGRHVC